MIIACNVIVTSTYEYHFITIYSTANIAYVPRHKIVGLSKLIELFSFVLKDRKCKND